MARGAPGVERDPGGAFAWTSVGAQRGDADSMFHLGNAYRLGSTDWGVTSGPDKREARRWFLAAAEAGHASACVSLAKGLLESQGGGDVGSLGHAIELLERAATQGSQPAAEMLERHGDAVARVRRMQQRIQSN